MLIMDKYLQDKTPNICQRKLNKATNLKKQVQIHTDVAAYECEISKKNLLQKVV